MSSMDVLDAIKQRFSVRKYLVKEIPVDVIIRVLDAARYAPSYANMQGVRYIVVKNPDKVSKIKKAIPQKWIEGVPLFIAIISAKEWSGKKDEDMLYYTLDVGSAVESLMLAATAEGLGTCWIANFNEGEAKKVLKVPDEARIVALISLGLPDEKPEAKNRLPLQKIAFLDQYGQEFVKF